MFTGPGKTLPITTDGPGRPLKHLNAKTYNMMKNQPRKKMHIVYRYIDGKKKQSYTYRKQCVG